MFTAKFWKDASERAFKSAAQALVLVVGADGFDLLNFNFLGGLATVATAGILSYATSLASESIQSNESGSLIK